MVTMAGKKLGTRATLSGPGLLLRVEGAVLFVAALVGYVRLGGEALPFIALLLVPDLSMVGYLVNPRIGAAVYNAVHAYALPSLLLAVALAAGSGVGAQIACVWLAHIGIDRAVGYGLKYADAFKHTHLSNV
jgi:hypothetical protein